MRKLIKNFLKFFHQKNFNKFSENENGSATTLVVIVFTSLIFSTIMISWFMLQIYGVTVSGIALPQGIQGYSSTQDYTTNQINISTYVTKGEDEFIYNANIGRILGIKTNNNYFSNTWNYLLIDNIQKDQSGNIINNYHINNSVQKDYTIVIRYTGGDDQIEYSIRDDGLYQPMYFGIFIAGVTYSNKIVSYPTMNQITDVNIITKYNEDLKTCEFTFNGIIYTINDLMPRRSLYDLVSPNYYGGIASATQGFTVENFNSNNVISDNVDTNILVQFAAFIVIAFKLVVFNISTEYLPWELNVILIKSQCVALLIGILNMRSGS